MSEPNEKKFVRLYALLQEKERTDPDLAAKLQWAKDAAVPNVFLRTLNHDVRDLYFAMSDDEVFEVSTEIDIEDLETLDDAAFAKRITEMEETEPVRLLAALARLREMQQET